MVGPPHNAENWRDSPPISLVARCHQLFRLVARNKNHFKKLYMIFNFHLKANYKKLFLVDTYNLATFFKKNPQDLHRPSMGDLPSLPFHACIYGGIFALRSAAAREGGKAQDRISPEGEGPPLPFFYSSPLSAATPHFGGNAIFFLPAKERSSFTLLLRLLCTSKEALLFRPKKARCLL